MGGFKRKRKQKRSRDDPSEPPRKKGQGQWQKTPRENSKFEEYYKHMGVIPTDQFDEFMRVLKEDLPTTFRVSPIGVFSDLAQKKLQEFTQEMNTGEEIEGQVLRPPTPISWYPDNGAWYIKAGRGPIRSNEKYKKFHNFLTSFTEFGGVSRQEAVSMIPPLLLDVKSDHVVLDMCAAPGSKTTQMVEFMHLDVEDGHMPKGLIIANDVDEKRCYMMIHQVNRLSSPCVVATQHPAQKFPFVRMNEKKEEGDAHPDLVFDRILCDVPCSGDGTFRKNFDLWGKWNPGMGLGLHKIQVQIATRGVKLLKIGGRMVYSTCSLNPVEDEAVVAEILRRGKGSLRLVDVSQELVSLQREKGVNQWPVYFHNEYYPSLESVPESMRAQTLPSLYPPSAEEAAAFHLDRCMRILPHHQDTGGFFVAVIEKTDSIPLHLGLSKKELYRANKEKQQQEAAEQNKAEAASDKSTPAQESTTETPEAGSEVAQPKGKEGRGGRFSREDPFMFLEGERWEGAIENLKDFYGFNDNLPVNCLMCRSEGTCPRIYLISDAAQKILRYEENQCIRIVNMGLRLFGKHSFKDAICPYRINSEGLGPLMIYTNKKRCIEIKMSELRILLTEQHPHFFHFEESTQESLKAMEIGGLWYAVDATEYGMKKPLLLSGWRGKVSTHLLSNTTEARLLKALFVPNVPAEKKETPEEQAPVAEVSSESKTETN